MSSQRICILGGTGFVGSHLAARLAADGHRITVLSRQPFLHTALKVLPAVRVVGADVHDDATLTRAFADADAVVNLVGILNERGRNGSGFRRAHTELARKTVDACRRVGIRRLLHMSALNADAAKGVSYYLRSKGEAEGIVLTQSGPDLKVTAFQPSVIFGPGDSLINRFDTLLDIARAPVFPLACAEARFAPVFVGDVVEAFARALDDRRTFGQRYQLCGPEVLTLRQLVEYVILLTGRRRRVWALPDWLGRLQAAAFELLPGKPFSMDNYRSLQAPSICSVDGFVHFGIRPKPLSAVVPGYLVARHSRGRYPSFRRSFGRR